MGRSQRCWYLSFGWGEKITLSGKNPAKLQHTPANVLLNDTLVHGPRWPLDVKVRGMSSAL